MEGAQFEPFGSIWAPIIARVKAKVIVFNGLSLTSKTDRSIFTINYIASLLEQTDGILEGIIITGRFWSQQEQPLAALNRRKRTYDRISKTDAAWSQTDDGGVFKMMQNLFYFFSAVTSLKIVVVEKLTDSRIRQLTPMLAPTCRLSSERQELYDMLGM